MGRGSKPGERRGGRKKGVPNKVTAEARDAFKAVYEGRLEDLDRWLTETGDGYDLVKVTWRGKRQKTVTVKVGKDPGKAAELLLRMAEHFVPKLSRTEVTGKDGGSVVIEIHKIAAAPEAK